MLDRKYFEEGILDYATYLCELKNYIESKTGFNINFEYKDHCDEIIDTINCVHSYDSSNIKCNDQNNYNNEYYYNYSPKTKKQIADITQKWNKINPDEITEEINGNQVTHDLYKLYYDANKNKYYHKVDNKPQPIPKSF